MTEKKSVPALSLEYFKIQKEVAKLQEKQAKIKTEMLESYKTAPFGKQDTLLGYVSVVKEKEFVYDNPKVKEEVETREAEVKTLKEEIKELKKQGTSVSVEGGKVMLKFVPNR